MAFRFLVPVFAIVMTLASSAAAGAGRLHVSIEGLPPDQAAGVRSVLSIARLADEDEVERTAVRRAHDRAGQEIRDAMEIYGYYHSTVKGSLNATDGGGWSATYLVRPGEPVRIEAMELSLQGDAAHDAAFVRWRKEFPLAVGDVFQHERYEDGKSKLLRLAEERGYFHGQLLRHEVTVDAVRNSASVHLSYDSGPRYRFGAVTFDQDTFDETYLRRFLGFATGEPYHVDALYDLERVLRDTGLFAEVTVRRGDPDAATQSVPVTARLVPRKRSGYDFGLGYATDTGARGKAAYERRWVNARGHSFRTEITASDKLSDASFIYHIPLRDPARQELLLGAAWVDENTDTSTRRTTTLSASVVRHSARWWHSYGLNYEREDFIVGDDDGSSSLLIPHLGWRRTSTEDRLHVDRGWQVGIDLKGAMQGVLSDFSFVQASVNAKFIQPLGGAGRLIARGTAGTTWVDEFADLPPSLRFFTGGDSSVRGYDYESLGARNEDGEVIGGKHLLVASVEYEHRLDERFSIAAFYDAGSAFDGDGLDLSKGAGVGLRWRLPFGSVRFDLANALSREGRPWRVHLTVGPDL